MSAFTRPPAPWRLPALSQENDTRNMHPSLHTSLLLAFCAAPGAIARRAEPLETRLYGTGPAPRWPATWSLANSSVIQPCNYTGFVQPIEFYAQFGIVDFDWSSAKSLWVRPPMQCDLLLEQCALLKAANPAARCFVYRNLVKSR